MDFSKVFNLVNNKLVDAEKIILKGKEDSEIRKIILENFSKLFPYLELFNSQFNYFTKPRIFLVNPSNHLIKKWQLKEPNKWGSHFYFIETETSDGFQKAKNLLTDFIKEKN